MYEKYVGHIDEYDNRQKGLINNFHLYDFFYQ